MSKVSPQKSSPLASISPNAMKNVTSAFVVLSSLVVIAINGYILNYLLNLEKSECECSAGWQRDFIKYYSVVSITVSSIMILLVLSGLKLTVPLKKLLNVVSYILRILTLVNLFVLYHYSTNLVLKNCNCSANTARGFMKCYSMIIIGVFALAIIFTIVAQLVIHLSN